MAFTLDASGPYIRVTITESVTGQDIGEIGRRIAELEVGLKVIPHRIVDTTGMTGGGDTGYRDVSSFMASRARFKSGNPTSAAMMMAMPHPATLAVDQKAELML